MTTSEFSIVNIIKKDDQATVYEISSGDDVDSDYFDEGDYKKMIDWFNNTDFLKQAGIKRGDIVHNVDMGTYRNDGIFIFDGTTLCYLDDEIDEYGSVPSSFLIVNEFPVYYWDHIIAHNSLAHSNLSDFKIVFDEYKSTYYDKKVYVYFGKFDKGSDIYGVFVLSQIKCNPIELIQGVRTYDVHSIYLEEIDKASELFDEHYDSVDGFMTLYTDLDHDYTNKDDDKDSDCDSDSSE